MGVTRRRLVGLAGGTFVLLAAPSAVAQTAIRRIGFLGSGSASSIATQMQALRDALRGLGYVEGRTVAFDYRWAEGRFERLPQLTQELLRLNPDVLLVWGTPATLAAMEATGKVPIVMCNTGDPDATGIVASLSRPGGNVTGVANLGGKVVAKQLELLRQIIPGLSRIAVLRNPGNASLVPQLQGAEAAARTLSLKLQVLDVSRLSQLDGAFASMTAARAEGVLVLADPFYFDQAKRIAELATKSKLPTVSARAGTADSGILVTYGASTVEQFRSAAVYVDKIMRGAKPGELPVEQAATFELVVNLRTAKALGLTVPMSLLTRANRVIE
jgi:putative ABC transport system substrate-binding protein